ncbi:MAG: exosome complex RNA-binding protein Rrp4 [Candidatus Nanoarchaeia archaeon]|nr:exosome complex RNA-binding protein Rrp4 [Candidatus Nanoarchaeia archaeon]
MGLLVSEKDIVIPGQIIADGMDYLPAMNTYRGENNIISTRVGLIRVVGRSIKVIPLSGRYIPKAGDTVIGRITAMSTASWFVDIGYASEAGISLKDATSEFIERGADLSQYFDFDELVVAKITNVTKTRLIDLTVKGPGLRKLVGGRIVKITSTKVPRVIGKQGSMISVIKNATNTRIIVGQNGWVWISGESPEEIQRAADAIQMIEREAHTEGLTDKVEKFLGGKKNDSNIQEEN